MAIEIGVGKRRRVTVNGKRIYVIVTAEPGAKPRVSWTMPHENRAQITGRRISPHEARQIKAVIQRLIKEIAQGS